MREAHELAYELIAYILRTMREYFLHWPYLSTRVLLIKLKTNYKINKMKNVLQFN